ncbi:MAG TPA: KH domain-containing protein [Candidatus Methanomethylophilaceae archaeon]|nr:KH domain-containing protein [Candidatus Methanomethylophilaceae archaeon]
MRVVRITVDRIGVLIGKSGETKKMLQKVSGLPMRISKDGTVTIDDEKTDDPLMALKLVEVVRAIGRGFNPEDALRLLDDDEYLEIIDLKESVADKQMSRVRGRLIGRGGKTKEIIEDLTLCDMIVYGNTVGLIGNSISLPVAKHAVEMIVNGSEHSSVYSYLEGQRPRLRISEMGFDL